jgi:hypothetical protein
MALVERNSHKPVEALVSEAALTLAALEECRHSAMLKLAALDSERPTVAYAIAGENSVTAKQRWRELFSMEVDACASTTSSLSSFA